MNMPILNRLLECFDFRKKHNRTDLNIQAVDLLREALEQKGAKQKDVAEKLGISTAAVSKTLSLGDKNLELNTLADFATALDMRFSLTLTDDPHCIPPLAVKQERISYRKEETFIKFGDFVAMDVSIEPPQDRFKTNQTIGEFA